MPFEDVAIVEIAESEKSRGNLDRGDPYQSLEKYHQQMAREILDSVELEKDDIDGYGMVSPGASTPLVYPPMLVETLGFEDLEWLGTTREGGASAVSLLEKAALAIEGGVANTVLCTIADLPIDPYRDTESGYAWDRDQRGFARNHQLPYGSQGPNSKIAHATRRHMAEFGTTEDQLGEIAITQRHHATLNPLAFFDEEIDMDDYRSSPIIASPHRLLDCVMRVNGACGFLLTRRDLASDLVDTPIFIEGHGNSINPQVTERPDITRTGLVEAGQDAFERADLQPAAVDFLQLYDDYPIVVLMQLEDLGYCEKGEGGTFVEQTTLRYDGDLPVNTGGGQLSCGQPGLASGAIQLLEGVRQLKQQGGRRQVPGAQSGVVTGTGGIGYAQNLQSFYSIVLTNPEGHNA